MSDRIDEVARHRAIKETKQRDPWYRVVLNFILLVLVVSLVLMILGMAANALWHLFLVGWEIV